MRTLEHYVGIGKHLDGIESRLAVLARMFKEESPRSTLDEALIAAFNERAGTLAASAAGLLAVAYDPTTLPETPPAPPSSESGAT